MREAKILARPSHKSTLGINTTRSRKGKSTKQQVPTNPLLKLHKTFGNRAVGKLIQTAPETGLVYESTVLQDIHFYANPKLYLYFESEVFERLRINLSRINLPQSWGPDLMHFKSNFRRDVYNPLIGARPLPKTVTIAVDVRKGANPADSSLLFGIMETSTVSKPDVGKLGSEAGAKESIKKIREEAKRIEVPEGLDLTAEILEAAEMVLVIVKAITHWTPLALAGTVLTPLSTLFTMAGGVEKRKQSGYLKGIEMSLKAARRLASEKPKHLYPITAEQLEAIVHRTELEGLWVDISMAGEVSQRGAREGMVRVADLLNTGLENARRELESKLDELDEAQRAKLSDREIQAAITYVQGYVVNLIVDEGLKAVEKKRKEILEELLEK